MERHEIQENSQQGKGLAWVAALLVSLCCICTCVFLLRSTGIFRELFKGLGVELPLTTRLLIATYSWLYPLLFVGAAVLVIAKEFALRDVRSKLAATVIIFVAAVSSAGLVQYVLYLPLLELVKKLSQAK
jgi:type II secretory pathway component PulF